MEYIYGRRSTKYHRKIIICLSALKNKAHHLLRNHQTQLFCNWLVTVTDITMWGGGVCVHGKMPHTDRGANISIRLLYCPKSTLTSHIARAPRRINMINTTNLLRGQRLIVPLSVQARWCACSDEFESYSGGSQPRSQTNCVPQNPSIYPRSLPILTYTH